jgi:hypothetical protein
LIPPTGPTEGPRTPLARGIGRDRPNLTWPYFRSSRRLKPFALPT